MSFCQDEIASLEGVNISLANQSRMETEFNNNQNEYQYTDEPIKLIDFSKGFEINPKALALLNSIKEDIIVVSVVGKARTGKSYLMNLLLDNVGKDNKGFKVASSLASCTKGIWLWNNVKRSINSSNAKILFLDSEGTSSTDKSTKTYDSRIFALVVLISSLFLFNTHSNIDENGIGELGLAAHLSKSITTNSDINKDELLTELSPKFIWIIRDFTLEMRHPETGQEITSKEYLEECLKKKRCGKNAKDNNLTRENIIKYFPDRDCVTLVRPVEDEKDLQKLNSIPFNNLKSSFKIEFKKLKDKIYKEALPKKYNGKRLNGPGLACLIEEFVKTINSGKIPNINNSWDAIIEKDINTAYDKAITFYKSSTNKLNISSNNKYNNTTLLRKLYSIQYETLSLYNALMLTNNSDTLQHKQYNKLYTDKKEKVIEQVNAIHAKLIEQNDSYNKSSYKNILSDKYHKLEQKLFNNKYTMKNIRELNEDYGEFMNEFHKETKGDLKCASFVKFVRSKENTVVEYLCEMVNKENEKNYRKVESSYKMLLAEVEEVGNKQNVVDQQDKMNCEKIEDLQKENDKLQEEIDDLNESIKMKKDSLEKIRESNRIRKENKLKMEKSKELKDNDSTTKDKKKKRGDSDGCRCGNNCVSF